MYCSPYPILHIEIKKSLAGFRSYSYLIIHEYNLKSYFFLNFNDLIIRKINFCHFYHTIEMQRKLKWGGNSTMLWTLMPINILASVSVAHLAARQSYFLLSVTFCLLLLTWVRDYSDNDFKVSFFQQKLAGISRDLYIGNSYYFCKSTTHYKGAGDAWPRKYI